MSVPKYSIIPKPRKYEAFEDTYTVTCQTAVLCVPEFKKAGVYLSNFLKTDKNAGDGAIKFKTDSSVPAEFYRLKINKDGITVSASDERGAFYGAVTLKIMLLQSKDGTGKAVLNSAEIFDGPRYSHRGAMLDESRHFFGKEAVKRLLDEMAMLKLNKFHWHLSDDQGYRIESEVFPLLNEISSKRKYEFLGGDKLLGFMKASGEEYFHYYKKSEIREIVEYADSLCIDIIPEIDMPGHTVALIAAYNELSCRKNGCEPLCENGITEEILCAGQEKTYEFCEKLLAEVCELFPYKYFHLGGDEASRGFKIYEKECPECQKVMNENNLKDGAQLQELFVNRINAILKKYGKRAIEWNDGIGDITDKDITCHYWINRSRGWLKKQASIRKFIVSPVSHFYFDMSYARIPLKKIYNFDPVKAGLAGLEDRVIGTEFETWTEWITDENAVQFSVFPRIYAMAENAWTEFENRNYRDFYRRLEFFKSYMRAKNINYSRVEKGSYKAKNRTSYSLGKFGSEYKLSEKLKGKEQK